jgi:hypothetical protein
MDRMHRALRYRWAFLLDQFTPAFTSHGLSGADMLFCAGAAALPVVSRIAAAQSYPTRPVTKRSPLVGRVEVFRKINSDRLLLTR